MVGGLADWFAVVALFRHPLGVPIPHTAIITERKEQFGETLGEFIQSSFLTGDAVAERVRAANVGDRSPAGWPIRPTPTGWPGTCSAVRSRWSTSSRTRTCTTSLERLVRDRLEAASIVPDGGTRPRRAHQGGPPRRGGGRGPPGPRPLPRRAPGGAARALARPGAVVAARGRWRTASSSGSSTAPAPCSTTWPTTASTGCAASSTSRSSAVVEQLQTSPELRAPRASSSPATCSSAPSCAAWIASAWTDAKAQLRAQSADPESALRQQVAAAITAGGERLLAEPALVAKIDDAAEAGARYVVEHFGGEINQLVATTIDRWDGEETSDRLELLLGPDLQFIRINGTVVGGLAGLGAPLDRPGARVIRAARPSDYSKLSDIERRAGELFREAGMPEIADHEPFDADELASAAALFVATGRGRRAGRLRHGRAGRRPRPPRADLGAPGARRPGRRHPAARRRRRLGPGPGPRARSPSPRSGTCRSTRRSTPSVATRSSPRRLDRRRSATSSPARPRWASTPPTGS